MLFFILGLIMFFGSLWGGYYFYNYFEDTTAETPYVVTCGIIAVAGVLICGIGISRLVVYI